MSAMNTVPDSESPSVHVSFDSDTGEAYLAGFGDNEDDEMPALDVFEEGDEYEDEEGDDGGHFYLGAQEDPRQASSACVEWPLTDRAHAEQNLNFVGYDLEMAEDDEATTYNGQSAYPEETESAAGGTAGRPAEEIRISRDQLVQLLRNNGARLAWAQHLVNSRMQGLEDENDEGDGSDTSVEPLTYHQWRSQFRPSPNKPVQPFEPVPNPEGQRLMESGTFGTNERPENRRYYQKHQAIRLLRRELGMGTPGVQTANMRQFRQAMLPCSKADSIINYNYRCYSGQFSKDGNFFFSCAQDMRVRLYDTSNPYDWKYYKTVVVHMGNWTITDATLSPDNRFIAASSIRNLVTLATTDPESSSDDYKCLQHLDFARMSPGANTHSDPATIRWGIWSLRFSGDGREIVAGTSDNCVYVYDISRQQSVLRIPGHSEDVNAVCYGDEASPHILYSGSDDSTLKVWDRRSLGDGRAAGVFVGHTEGLTYVDSKGDGRYVISNGKDQTAKLWDLRRVVSTEEAEGMAKYSCDFDYRQDEYDFSSWRRHPNDCSLVTFRGHRVLKTLIRCHFSPLNSSDGRYVYSGSQDGKVWIWNMDGTVKKTLDVYKETYNTRSEDEAVAENSYWDMNQGVWRTVVRDASWHPDVGMIAATSWNGYGCSWGTCSIHSWHGDLDVDDEETVKEFEDQGLGCPSHRVERRGFTSARRFDALLRDMEPLPSPRAQRWGGGFVSRFTPHPSTQDAHPSAQDEHEADVMVF